MSLWKNYLHQRSLQVGLTSQQKEIFLLIFGERKSRQEVSDLLNVSSNACQQCLGEIYSKFELFSRSRGKEKSLYLQLRRQFQEEYGLSDSAVETLEADPDNGQGQWDERLMTPQLNFDQAYEWLAEKITSQGERLKEVDKLILKGAWERVSYKKLAEQSRLSLGYLQSDAGASLWKLVTQVLGADVTKRNLRTVLEGQMQQQLCPPQIQHLLSESTVRGELEKIKIPNLDPENLVQYVQDLDLLFQAYPADVLLGLETENSTFSGSIKAVFAREKERLQEFVRILYKQGFEGFGEGQFELPSSEERQQKFDRAELYLQIVLKLQADYHTAYYTLGELYLERSDLEQATEYFHKARVYKSAEPWALNYLGYISLQRKDYEKAEYLLIQALRALKRGENDFNPDVIEFLENPEDIKYLKSTILKNLGWVIFAQNKPERYPEAEAKLEQSIELDPDYAPPYCLLAQVKEALHKPAWKEWKKCLALASPWRGPEEAEWVKLATQRIMSLGEVSSGL
jgi:tetratricopeptide (TPR) repeat protein